eukprot:Hpha_TRINITY_DN20479_c0_g1::TRINITY_DN20479_c0_g1_i1::g.64190::m.64190/K08967/mtnD, mtnZ, ADI1; 1,2-dihydroxy-3-keto-5-methylthiopentene dioxygenase
MAFAMDSASFDKVSAYTTGKNKARSNWRKAGHAVIASHRLLDAMALPGTSRRGNLAMDRAAEKARRAKAEAERVSEEQVSNSLRRNSSLTKQMLRERSSSVTDLSKTKDQLIWTKAWYLNSDGQAAQLSGRAAFPNRRASAQGQVWVSQDELEDVGVVFMHMPLGSLAPLDELVKDRGYVIQEEVIGEKLETQGQQAMFREHFLRDELIAHIHEGECFFDVRDRREHWVRLHLRAGDLLIIPGGCCHRWALTGEARILTMKRYFRQAEEPLWVPVYRSEAGAESEDARAKYVSSRRRGTVCEDNNFARAVDED